MLELRAYTLPEQATIVVDRLAAVPGVHHVVAGGLTARGRLRITAEVEAHAADAVLDLLGDIELTADDVTLWRTNRIRFDPLRRGARDSTMWSEVIGRAGEHARIATIYLSYMVAAGVVAGVGVLSGSSILVVGAMALSPDLLPISATAVGLAQRNWSMTWRALVTLGAGLGVAMAAATGATGLLRLSDRIEEDLDLPASVLGPSLTEIGPGSILVALAAGMAGMLAYETAGGAAVGVAISVTTIPAAAYIGVAIGLGGGEDAVGALAVLGTNVAGLVIAAALTLLAQGRLRRRRVAS